MAGRQRPGGGWWLLILGLLLLLGAGSLAGLAWLSFRRKFVGLRQSLEELREDAVWLHEWIGGEESTEGTAETRRRGEGRQEQGKASG
ncbi:MAG: hypothetical protein ABSG68_16805 [Thermoguttaceae bacterium]